MSRTDSPRTNEAITSVSNALVLVTCLPNNPDANAQAATEELGDLGLQVRLNQQLSAQTGVTPSSQTCRS